MSPTGSSRRGLVVISLLVLGAAAGITADRLLHGAARDHVLRFEDVHDDPTEMIARAFDLQPEQRTQITAIIERRQHDINAAWHDARAHINATVDSVVDEIAAVLDSADRPRFRALADSLHRHGRVRLHR